MLNAIGLANPGVAAFVAEHLPRLAELGVPLWGSVVGFSAEDHVHVAERLGDRAEIEALELNLSCPNVDEVPENVNEVVAAVREVTPKPLYAKLSAAVADLGATPRAGEWGGAGGPLHVLPGDAAADRRDGRRRERTARARVARRGCHRRRRRHWTLRRPRCRGPDPLRAGGGAGRVRLRQA